RSALIVSHCTFTRNQAIGGAGSAGRAGGDAQGGGLPHQKSDPTTPGYNSLIGNPAIGGGGGAPGASGGRRRRGGAAPAPPAAPPGAVPAPSWLSHIATSAVPRRWAARLARAATLATAGAGARLAPSDSPLLAPAPPRSPSATARSRATRPSAPTAARAKPAAS